MTPCSKALVPIAAANSWRALYGPARRSTIFRPAPNEFIGQLNDRGQLDFQLRHGPSTIHLALVACWPFIGRDERTGRPARHHRQYRDRPESGGTLVSGLVHCLPGRLGGSVDMGAERPKTDRLDTGNGAKILTNHPACAQTRIHHD